MCFVLTLGNFLCPRKPTTTMAITINTDHHNNPPTAKHQAPTTTTTTATA
jgi:hypothetical protein